MRSSWEVCSRVHQNVEPFAPSNVDHLLTAAVWFHLRSLRPLRSMGSSFKPRITQRTKIRTSKANRFVSIGVHSCLKAL